MGCADDRYADSGRFTPEWVFGRKYDGIRLLAFLKGNTVHLLSRDQLPPHYPAFADATGDLGLDEVILGGEVIGGSARVSITSSTSSG